MKTSPVVFCTLICLFWTLILIECQTELRVPLIIDRIACNKEPFSDPSYFIIHQNGVAILRKCEDGYRYSPLFCRCVLPMLSRIPRMATEVNQERILEEGDSTISCHPTFRFVFDSTTNSDDNSVAAFVSDAVRFTHMTGGTGKTCATFYGNGIITIWRMSYITFAKKFKFIVRFKLFDKFPYEDKEYNLFGDGPCSGREPHYGVTVNPVQKSINGTFLLQNGTKKELRLKNVDFSSWVLLFITGVNRELRMFTGIFPDLIKDQDYIGISTVKSSSCSLEIGKDSQYATGFVGYVDLIEFYNCFEK